MCISLAVFNRLGMFSLYVLVSMFLEQLVCSKLNPVHALCLRACVFDVQVADCVCLMSLDKSEAVPVDTHVWQIATRDYGFIAGSKQKTLTDKVYKEIGE